MVGSSAQTADANIASRNAPFAISPNIPLKPNSQKLSQMQRSPGYEPAQLGRDCRTDRRRGADDRLGKRLAHAMEPNPMDHSELFRTVGPLIWGNRWQTDMAQALGVTDRTVRRWVSGAAVPQPGVWMALAQLVQQRQRELAGVAKPLEQAAEG
jgi:hypothetical protein